MSLLTSSATSRDNQRFINKIEKEFTKRSFFHANYSESPNPLKQLNDSTDQVSELIKQSIDHFLDSLKQIISEAHNNRIDYYFILSKMKNSDFFNEVAGILREELIAKNTKLQKQNSRLREQFKKMQHQLRETSKLSHKTQKNEINRFNGIKSIAQNLYMKAKIMNEEQFTQMCNKVLLENKVVIKKVNDGEAYRKWDQLKVDKVEEQQLLKRIDAYIEKREDDKGHAQDAEFVALISSLRKINEEAKKICRKPCCLQRHNDEISLRTNKVEIVRKSVDARHPSQVYKDDKSQEYFNRYYRRSEFDIHKIISVQQTKLEQMQKLQDSHRVTMKMRRKVQSLLSR